MRLQKQLKEKKELLEALGIFMEKANNPYQNNQYKDLNKAFKHLNNLYEKLADDIFFAENDNDHNKKTKELTWDYKNKSISVYAIQ